MFNLILLIIRVVFFLIPTKQMDMIIENSILKKEDEILKRKKKGRIKFRFLDRLFYSVICKMSEKAKGYVTFFTYDLKSSVHLIHDRTGGFWINQLIME